MIAVIIDVFVCVGIVRLAVGCRYLQVVYLRRCVNVDDVGIIAVADNCRQLRDLNIGGCTLVTDAALQAIGQHSSMLSSINFSHANVCTLHSANDLLIVFCSSAVLYVLCIVCYKCVFKG